jgi:hypothetical protein
MFAFAERIVDAKKVVFSKTLDNSDPSRRACPHLCIAISLVSTARFAPAGPTASIPSLPR